jgi:hypothetical protein
MIVVCLFAAGPRRVGQVAIGDEPRQPIKNLEWADLAFEIKYRTHFDPGKLPENIRALEGKRVRVRGYMHLSVAGPNPRSFLLIGEVTTPSIKPFGLLPDELPIHQLAEVEIADGRTTAVTPNPIAVTGTLEFKVVEWEGKAFLVFRIVANSVEQVEPRNGYRPALANGC